MIEHKTLEQEIKEYNEFLLNDLPNVPLANKYQVATQIECELMNKYNLSYRQLDELHSDYRRNLQ